MNIVPLFRTHYSLGRAILTLDAPSKELDENSPVSVFDIAKKAGLKRVVVVDSSISGFLEANKNAEKAGVELTFGLLVRCMENIENKSEASLKTISNVIVFGNGEKAYSDLVKISSCASKKGFYYKPNIDFEHLKALWTENLLLAIPFYDSFLFNNSLYGFRCVPNFSFAKPVFFIEESGLPFDSFMREKVKKYAESIRAEVIPARSIYYYKNSDFLTYLAFRCIHDRTTLNKPEIEHCSSDMFSFETWEAQNQS